MRLSKAELDKTLGLEVYISSENGISGKIKHLIEDFIVEEISENGLICPVNRLNYKIEEGSGEYTWFIMVKRGLDSLSALRKIGRFFGMSIKRFSLAGLKDAQALTSQLACVDGLSPEDLLSFKDSKGKVRVIMAFRRPFKLMPGMLYGNRFRITIRNIELSKAVVEKRVKKIIEEIESEGGLPAYYGYQRFGTIRPITHIVGRYILKKDFEAAIWTLLTKIFPHESERAKKAREYLLNTRDFKGAFELFPKTLHHERRILYYLSNHPGDYAGAFRALPLTIRRLFISAFQAYLFNRVLSERLKNNLPLNRAVVGDIVAVFSKRNLSIRVKGIFRANSLNVDKLNEFINRGAAHLVLNVFGYNTILCDGIPGEIERKVLKEEGVSIKDFYIKHMPEISSSGTYRLASFKPEELEVNEAEIDDVFTGKNKLRLGFVLRKGMYATVFLRELMKPNDIYKAGY